MPFCWKCGAKLDEDAKFCPTCGTPVAPPATKPEKRRIKREERRPMRPRFSGTTSLLQSDNYPAGSNFNVSLKTTTGGIDIDAKYTP